MTNEPQRTSAGRLALRVFFRLQVHERVEISLIEVYERVGKTVISVFQKAQKGQQMHFMALKIRETLSRALSGRG